MGNMFQLLWKPMSKLTHLGMVSKGTFINRDNTLNYYSRVLAISMTRKMSYAFAIILFYLFIFVVLGIKSSASLLTGKCSDPKLHLQPILWLFYSFGYCRAQQTQLLFDKLQNGTTLTFFTFEYLKLWKYFFWHFKEKYQWLSNKAGS
jgi:hypothetical protein